MNKLDLEEGKNPFMMQRKLFVCCICIIFYICKMEEEMQPEWPNVLISKIRLVLKSLLFMLARD